MLRKSQFPKKAHTISSTYNGDQVFSHIKLKSISHPLSQILPLELHTTHVFSLPCNCVLRLQAQALESARLKVNCQLFPLPVGQPWTSLPLKESAFSTLKRSYNACFMPLLWQSDKVTRSQVHSPVISMLSVNGSWHYYSAWQPFRYVKRALFFHKVSSSQAERLLLQS